MPDDVGAHWWGCVTRPEIGGCRQAALDKAAAVLHGVATRQVFENDNKRTAGAAAVALPDINGIDLGYVDTVHSDII